MTRGRYFYGRLRHVLDLGKPQSTRSMRAMFRIIDGPERRDRLFEFQLLFWKLHQKASFEADTLHGSSNDIATAEVPDDAQHETSKANEKSSVMNNFIASSSAIDSSGQGETPQAARKALECDGAPIFITAGLSRIRDHYGTDPSVNDNVFTRVVCSTQKLSVWG